MGKVIMSGIVPLLKYVDSNIVCTLLDTNGNPVPGVIIDGIVDRNGKSVASNSSGIIRGFISEGSNTLSISGYADIEDFSTQVTLSSGEVLKKNITITTIDYLKITSAMSLKFSGNVETVDVALGGGGAGGSWGTTNYPTHTSQIYQQGGTGGGAGQVAERIGIIPEIHTTYNAVVGAGGGQAAAGGESSFMGVTAAGGKVNGGGAGARINYPIIINGSVKTDGSTVAATAGTNGTGFLYASMTETFAYGGSGGGGGAAGDGINYYYERLLPAVGGTPGGGKGYNQDYYVSWTNAQNGADGLGGGGGGAGSVFEAESANYDASMYSNGAGKGGSGCITIRMHLKSAS